MAISKETRLTERWRVEIRGEAFNIFNHVNFALPSADLAASEFGQITNTVGEPAFRAWPGTAEEFLRRFMLHVLPRGFVRFALRISRKIVAVSNYGLFASDCWAGGGAGGRVLLTAPRRRAADAGAVPWTDSGTRQ